MAHKPPTKSLQRSLPYAILDASLKVRPSLPFSSASTDLLHVIRGLPRLRLSSGFQYRASLVTSFGGFLRTWPIQLHLLLASSTMMSSWLHFSLTLLLLISMGHLIRKMTLRHLCTNEQYEVLKFYKHVSADTSTIFGVNLNIMCSRVLIVKKLQ